MINGKFSYTYIYAKGNNQTQTILIYSQKSQPPGAHSNVHTLGTTPLLLLYRVAKSLKRIWKYLFTQSPIRLYIVLAATENGTTSKCQKKKFEPKRKKKKRNNRNYLINYAQKPI